MAPLRGWDGIARVRKSYDVFERLFGAEPNKKRETSNEKQTETQATETACVTAVHCLPTAFPPPFAPRRRSHPRPGGRGV